METKLLQRKLNIKIKKLQIEFFSLRKVDKKIFRIIMKKMKGKKTKESNKKI